MLTSFKKRLLLVSTTSLLFACTSTDTEYTFDKKPVSAVESKNGNIVVHFKDNTTQSLSAKQIETLLKEKKIGESVYQLFTQKIKEAQAKQPKPTVKANKEPYPYRLNGRDVHYVELKNGMFTIHLADKASQSFSQHEIDCMFINYIITQELFMKCFEKQAEEEISRKKDSSGLYYSYRKIECPEFN